jgi:hypothetical protein
VPKVLMLWSSLWSLLLPYMTRMRMLAQRWMPSSLALSLRLTKKLMIMLFKSSMPCLLKGALHYNTAANTTLYVGLYALGLDDCLYRSKRKWSFTPVAPRNEKETQDADFV